MRGSLILIIFSAFIILTFSSSVSETQAKASGIKQWIIVNTLLVDKNNVKIRIFYLDSPPTNVKTNARRSCKDGVNIILPAYMLMKYEGDPFRIDFDLKESRYRVFEKSEKRIISEGSLHLEI